MQPLTPDQKIFKKQQSNLRELHNRILASWSFGELKTWHDVYKKLGLPEISINNSLFPLPKTVLMFPELKQYLQQQKDKLEYEYEQKIKDKNEQNSQIRESENAYKKCATINSGLSKHSSKFEKSETQNDIGKEEINGKEINNEHEQTAESNNKIQPITEVRDSNMSDTQSGTNDNQIKQQQGTINSQEKENNLQEAEEKVNGVALTPDNNYGLSVNENEQASLYWFQKKAAAQILDKILNKKLSGILLLAGTGTGKTFMIAAVHRRLVDSSYEEGKTFSHIPYLYLTRTTVVEQAKRVFDKQFNLNINNIEIVNIETLRSKAGKLWVKEIVKIEDGEEESTWVWKTNINPVVVYFDESQAAKNSTSTQHKIMCAYTHLPKNNCLISISATPFTRVIEAKCFAISTKRPLDHLPGFPKGSILCEETWPSYAAIMAGASEPDEYNQEAIARLMKDLDGYVVRVRGVRPQFHSINDIKLIDFETKEDRDYYYIAWERYLKELAKKEQELETGVSSNTFIFVKLQQYSIAAEVSKARFLARKMWEDVTKRNKAAVCAVKWKATIIKIVMILIEDYGISREQISLIWGGGQTQLTKKQKAKQKIKGLASKLEAQGLSVDDILEDTQLNEIEDRELLNIPEQYKLGQQDLITRQVEIDRFQSGKSLFCLYTFRAGGVGLSLHHTDEQTEFKCRRKESGYAVEEDIPSVPVRPRTNSIALTYNAIEFAQAFGRVPRLTSLSESEQTVYLLRGTIEEESMYPILSAKLRCISSVIQMKESWECVYTTNIHARNNVVKEVMDKTKDNKQEDTDGLIEEGEE